MEERLIGGTRTRVGACSMGELLARREFPTRGMEEVDRAIRDVLSRVGWGKPAAIGVAGHAPKEH